MAKVLKSFTVSQILDAIEENGLPQTKKGYWRGVRNFVERRVNVKSACALGMAAYNLHALGPSSCNVMPYSIEIISWNDVDGLTFKEIADKYRKEHPVLLDATVKVWVQE
jgi:hypothetical protein